MPYTPLYPDLPLRSILTPDHIAHIENGIVGAERYADEAAAAVQAGAVSDTTLDAAITRAVDDGRITTPAPQDLTITEAQEGVYQIADGTGQILGLTAGKKLPAAAKTDLATDIGNTGSAIRGAVEGAVNAAVPGAPIVQYGKPDPARAILQSRLERLNATGGKISFAGDSITEGNANGGVGWFSPWKALYPNVTFVNRGHGGKTTGDFLSTYMAELTTDNADLYVVALGCNDIRYVNQTGTTGAKTGAEFATNLTNIVNQLGAARCVVVNPWMTTVRDYAQDVSHAAMERAYWEYDAAAIAAMATLGVPYIRTTGQMMGLYRDLTGTSDWNGDGVHPNNKGVALYADAVLNGVPPRTKHTLPPKKAAGKYLYKLEILSRAPGDTTDRVYLKKLYATPAPAEIYGSSNRSGFMSPAGLLDAYSSTYGYVNIEGDYPFVLTFSTTTPLESLAYLSDGARKGIGNYRLWTSTDAEAIGQIDHPSWKILENGTRDSLTYRRLLYSKFGQEREFFKIVFTSKYGTDPDVAVKRLGFRWNTGEKGVVAFRTSAPATENQSQMFMENQISTVFTTFPATIAASFPTGVRSFDLDFEAGRRGDGWAVHRSTDPAAMEDFNHPSWTVTRQGSFGGSTSVVDVENFRDIPSIPTYTTATRPAASRFGPGRMVFDTTLNKPVYSTGTGWVDATGVAA